MYSLILERPPLPILSLHEPGLSHPSRQAEWHLAVQTAAPAGRVEEAITLELKGLGIQDWIYQLEACLALARAGLQPLTLCLTRAAREEPLRSRVWDGWIELLGNALVERGRGYQGLRLHLIRENGWDAPAGSLELTNQNGSAVYSGLTVFNHSDHDGGHQNFVDIQAADVGGTQPSPAVVTLSLGTTPIRCVTDILLAAGSNLTSAEGSFEHVLEAELAEVSAGCSASLLDDPQGSNQAARRVEWSSAQETRLLSWELDAPRLSFCAGRQFRPVLRLLQPAAGAVYLRWKIIGAANGALVEQTAQVQAASGHCLIACAASPLPPVSSYTGTCAPLRLELWAEAPASAARSLEIDFVQLLPAEQWAHLRSLGGVHQGSRLVLDGFVPKVYALNAQNQEEAATHSLSGQPLYLRPGQPNRVYCLFETSGGMPASQSLAMQIFCGGRWQTA